MLSAVMKQASRWVIAPASPQCGLNRNVFIPLSLEKYRYMEYKQLSLDMSQNLFTNNQDVHI